MFPRKRDLNQLHLLSIDLLLLLNYNAKHKSLDGVSPKWTNILCIFNEEINR